MAHDHDRHYRYLFSHPGFVQRLLETFVDEAFVADLDFSTLRHLEGRFVDESFAGREADAVWSVQFRGRPVYIFLLMEFQSSVDVGMPVRFLRYITGLYQSVKPQRRHGRLPAVLPILIYNGERPWTAPRSFQEAVEPSIPARYIPAFRYYAIILRDFDPHRLARMRGAVAAVFYAERLDRHEVFAHLDTIVDIMKEEEPELRDMFRNWLAHATGVPGAPEAGERRVRTPEEEKRMLSSTVEAYERKLKEAARKEGREEGLEQGRQRALLHTARKMLARGMSVGEVVEVTELPRNEVEELLREIPGDRTEREERNG
ncbi:MAG: Rpn family recombination-promoting nuclease/putative transposase [Spirochaetes bacterium]|jgi:predicted transposase/invertase (TIGR01784 family)|nr:Rpn family recombination-promoting nuclease/putative transposase [Spirochaetota bacterium]